MRTRALIDVFVGPDGTAWRLYFAPRSWKPGHLGALDHGSIFPVARPDITALDRFMGKLGAPFQRRPTTDGGLEVQATGRAAVALVVWLGELVEGCSPPS